MKSIYRKLKGESAAVSILVLITVLTFVTVLTGAFLLVTTLRQSQLKSDKRIQEIYGQDVDNVNDIYAELTNVVAPEVNISNFAKHDTALFATKATINISDNNNLDFSKCKYIFSTESDAANIAANAEWTPINSNLINIEKVLGAGNWYLYVSVTDKAGNTTVQKSDNSVTIESVVNYDYATDEQGNGKEQTALLLPGNYKLECWGAQGGNIHNVSTDTNYNVTNGNIVRSGGYGGYSVGDITLSTEKNIYIYVGGQGTSSDCSTQTLAGGFNGGGSGGSGNVLVSANCYSGAGGGGATHIATVEGELKTLNAYKDTAGINESNEILIVAGGGGGALNHNFISQDGGNAGGYIGNSGITNRNGYSQPAGGSQSSGFAFGQGGNGKAGVSSAYAQSGNAGGGAGFFGGNANTSSDHSTSGAGGSGYINCPMLTNKHMVGYSVETSNDSNTNTTNNVSEEAQENNAKIGNGYARITNMN